MYVCRDLRRDPFCSNSWRVTRNWNRSRNCIHRKNISSSAPIHTYKLCALCVWNKWRYVTLHVYICMYICTVSIFIAYSVLYVLLTNLDDFRGRYDIRNIISTVILWQRSFERELIELQLPSGKRVPSNGQSAFRGTVHVDEVRICFTFSWHF